MAAITNFSGNEGKSLFFWFLHSYNEYGRSVDLAGTNSLRGPTQFTQRGAERRVSGWDGMGWNGVSKVSFNFLYTLWIYRSCIYIYLYRYIIVISFPLKPHVTLKFWSSWGS